MGIFVRFLSILPCIFAINTFCIDNRNLIIAVDSVPDDDSVRVQEVIQPVIDTAIADSALKITQTETDSLQSSITDTLSLPDTLTVLDSIFKDTLSIVMVGDVMLGTNYPSGNYLPPGNNCYPLLDSVKHNIRRADISFCNLEGVFAGESGTPKYCKDPKNCYVFRMPDEYIDCLCDGGFNLLSVANNHVNDFGTEGRLHATGVLEKAGFNFAGFSDRPYTLFEAEGLLVGFCAFAPNSGVVDLRDLDQAEAIVRFLSDTCDIVIVSMHAGAEGRDHQHVTREKEIFLGADRGNVYKFAHRMIDAGADVIIGHGPHVTRAMEIYNDRFIAYSLGNFATYSRFNLSGPNGIAPLVQISIDREGKFLSGIITPTMQTGEGGARIDPEKRVIWKIQELNRIDFPDNILLIDNQGNILHKMETE